jgi:hypothetical protein
MRVRRAGVAVALATALAAVVATTGHAAGTKIPAVGTLAAEIDLRTVPGAVSHGGGRAIPLRARQPAWYTEALANKVDAANGQPVVAPAGAPLPGVVGIRPGSWMVEPFMCTMNFVFRKAGSFAIGTAGHCTRRVGEEVVLLTVAPGGGNPVLVEVGTVLARQNGGIGNDFALVSVRPQVDSWVDPTIAVVGGPCGTYKGAGPETVAHYGHGAAIGTGGTPRVGVAFRFTKTAFGWVGAGIFGDSGSPVRVTDLAAAGNLTHLVVDTRWLPNYIVGTRIGRIQAIAGNWSLVNSSLCL